MVFLKAHLYYEDFASLMYRNVNLWDITGETFKLVEHVFVTLFPHTNKQYCPILTTNLQDEKICKICDSILKNICLIISYVKIKTSFGIDG